ncbi:MFS transporter [Hansschlegelia beijingensis]|uniref:DHA1 family inner membrane transport protein n=1 Tax=Hansschlegelia beijingensis TaxID=1133344 RepID=A0A7W6CWL4_9HYPH|nr:MFS transporter [Hansschlegelia beijingensis]MBB3971709.1 DHA1 family inner membrane transport protein [Hansschlegelia beijingensis]
MTAAERRLSDPADLAAAEAELAAAPMEAPHGAALGQLALAIGGFAIGTGEFAAMGILPSVATAVDVSIPEAGHMISAYALGVVVGAPAITVALARAPRRMLLIGLMAVFGVGNLLSALASSYESVIAARFIAGLPHGAYFGVAMLAAAALVPPARRARAVANVLLGLSVANVVGVPFATWLGQEFGWRTTFLVVAALAALTALSVRLFTPEIPAPEGASPRRELGALRRPQVWLTLGVAAIGFGGMFAVYSYVTPTLTDVTGLSLSMVPPMLALLGLGMIVGNVAGGWLSDRALKATLVGALVWNGAVLGAFVFTSAASWSAAINLFLIGGCIAMGPALQTRLMDVAGDAQTLAAALNHSAFNLANALGAWLGGAAIAMGFGWTSPGAVGALLAVAGGVVLFASFRLEAAERRRGAPEAASRLAA